VLSGGFTIVGFRASVALSGDLAWAFGYETAALVSRVRASLDGSALASSLALFPVPVCADSQCLSEFVGFCSPLCSFDHNDAGVWLRRSRPSSRRAGAPSFVVALVVGGGVCWPF